MSSNLPPPTGRLACLDPGRSKCGLVCTDAAQHRITTALVLPPKAAEVLLHQWHQQDLAAVVLGDGTGSLPWRRQLECSGLRVIVVDERGSTLAARERYWQLFPAQGWRRLLPKGLRQPPRDWDDVVAQLLLERWLERPLLRTEPAR
jgi:RNase H-fold protein (predicted Holliday junction resolvase)